MRKIFLSIFFLLILSACAFADAMFFRGTGNIGSVPSLDNSSGYSVSVSDAASLLGFTPSRAGEELILRKGNIQLRVILNSAAAWRGYTIIPLYSTPFEQDGRIWLDSQSTAALFQSSAGGERLKFVKTSGNLMTGIAQDTSKSELEFGKFNEESEPPAAIVAAKIQPTLQLPHLQREPAITVPSVQAQPVTPASAITVPSVQAQTVTPASAIAVPSVQTQPVTPAPAITVPSVQNQPTIAASQSAKEEAVPVMASSVSRSSKGKSQPRYETFKPNDRKTERGEIYSGTIQGIRWTMSEGLHKKIRAVVTTDENADPQVFMNDGELHALFSSSLESSSGISSPYSNIKAELKRSPEGIDLVFITTEITKAEKLVLSSPRRIAFEFFFPASVNIVQVNPITNQNPKANTAPVIAKTPEPPKQNVTPPSPPSIPKKNDPIIIINDQDMTGQAKTPAVQTPPSTITIPTVPGNTGTRRTILPGKKTIVVDAGHGGKDPGASDNNVTEKNVNLAVALELERELIARGFNVVMTRRTDVYLKLQERTDIANEVNADLFVSIHVNALPSKKSTTGIEVYIMALPTDKDAMNLAKVENREYVEGKGVDVANVDRRTEMLLRILGDMQQNNKISESTDFAAALYNSGVRTGLPMRRVAQAPFFVLRGAGMPAVLVETGFVTNADEAIQLSQPTYQNKIAKAMAEGIKSYLR